MYSLYNNALTVEWTNIIPYTNLNSGTIANMVIGVLLIVIIVNVIVVLIVVCIWYKNKGSFNTNAWMCVYNYLNYVLMSDETTRRDQIFYSGTNGSLWCC